MLILIISFYIILPYIIPIFTSMIFAYLFYPLYSWLYNKSKNKNFSAMLVTIFILFILTVPLVFLLFQVTKEAEVGYLLIKQMIVKSQDHFVNCDSGILCYLNDQAKNMLGPNYYEYYLQDSLKNFTQGIVNSISNFVFSIPKRMLDLLITFFMIFFLLKDGDSFVSFIKKYTPMKDMHKKRIFRQMKEVVRAVIDGFFVIALIEGFIGALTFYIFGVSSPVIWGIVIAFLALIPIIGATVVWVPIFLIRAFSGDVYSSVGILVGGLIIGFIDTFIKPKFIGKKAALNPALMIVGLVGGIHIFGLIGVVIGPLILGLMVTFLKILFED